MVSKEYLNNPQFNSGLSFILRLNWLMNLSHTFRIEANTEDKNSYLAYLSLLESINIEIDSHITTQERNQLIKNRKEAVLCLQKSSKEPMFDYHVNLNRFANKSGILMKYDKNLQELMKDMYGGGNSD